MSLTHKVSLGLLGKSAKTKLREAQADAARQEAKATKQARKAAKR